AVYGATDEGNFEGGTNVLHEALTVDEATARFSMARGDLERLLASARRTLLAARDKRVPPLLDDKILTDWNGLAIAALSRAGRVFGRPE
ncbi:MAG TPA: thioredoxin domain-containing protein, partial [Synergistaceae bacterium]|nr:thioredoxin domain-containing protein [Synergistaceae bacterium]